MLIESNRLQRRKDPDHLEIRSVNDLAIFFFFLSLFPSHVAKLFGHSHFLTDCLSLFGFSYLFYYNLFFCSFNSTFSLFYFWGWGVDDFDLLS